MNNMLLPAPVGITATTGLSPAIIAWMACCCSPLNLAASSIIRFNWAAVSIFLNRACRYILASAASLLNGAFFYFLLLFSSTPSLNLKKRC
jgi:hypothetical protein